LPERIIQGVASDEAPLIIPESEINKSIIFKMRFINLLNIWYNDNVIFEIFFDIQRYVM